MSAVTRTIRPGTVGGRARIPASKSHTIRALLIATLATGRSRLREPLDSLDTVACIRACRALGARIEEVRDGGHLTEIIVEGTGGTLATPDDIVDVGNSGTTLYLGMGTAATAGGLTVFTGDEQIRRRSAAPLLSALAALGATATSTRGNGCAPIVTGGGLRCGPVAIESPTSQYLSSLLLAAPLAVPRDESSGGSETPAAPADPAAGHPAAATDIEVLLLNEHPYVDMTLWWLDSQGIRYEREGYDRFRIPGCQHYHAVEADIPADFSSATFLACAAAITGSRVTLDGLDMADPQGDKAVLGILEQMGCRVESTTGGVVVTGPEAAFDPAAGHARPSLAGGRFDLNAIPDALPALAVTACFARQPVELVNVPQARAKETDRIAVMATELSKMGAVVRELEDGLVVRPRAGGAGPGAAGAVSGGTGAAERTTGAAPASAGAAERTAAFPGSGGTARESAAAPGPTGPGPGSAAPPPLTGAAVRGHGDHRVVMALAVAGLGAAGETTVDTAEAAAVTFPGFFETLAALGGRVSPTHEAAAGDEA
jgi:3-phosphoshikimate 1-carboxyvinyltransferase